jgi:hypothetical protein
MKGVYQVPRAGCSEPPSDRYAKEAVRQFTEPELSKRSGVRNQSCYQPARSAARER